jgi:hypothetical protein
MGMLCIMLAFATVFVGCGGGPEIGFTISYSVGEGSGTPPLSWVYYIGDGYSYINLPDQGNMIPPAGSIFNGWLANGETYTANAVYHPTGVNITFVAQWLYNASFDELPAYLADLEGGTDPEIPATVALTEIDISTFLGDINTLINETQKYVILDLSDCTAEDNTITGNQYSPSNNDMNIIQDNAYIKGIIMPSTIETIETYAFYNCDDLTNITIPESVTSIGDYAFSGCIALESIIFEGDIAVISSYAFPNFTGLKTAYDAGGAGTFILTDENGWENALDIAFGESLAEQLANIEGGTDSNNPAELKLAETNIRSSWYKINTLVEEAQKYVILDLSDCTAKNNTIIGQDSTYYTPSGNAMNIIEDNEYIKGIILPSTLETIGDYAFYECDYLRSITIPESVTSLGQRAFGNCSGFTSITFESGDLSFDANPFSPYYDFDGLETAYEEGGAGTYRKIGTDWMKDRNVTVTFSAGTGGSNPPESITLPIGNSIVLHDQGTMIAQSDKIFDGWTLDSIDYEAGDIVTINSDCTFTAAWITKKYAQQGIYISLISFAGDANILRQYDEDFIFLNTNGKSNLISILDSQYNKSLQSGTALFYGVHSAMANLKANEGEFPTDLSSVNMITFTDGLDNGSFLASANDPIEGKNEITGTAYATYVHEEIETRTINEKPINAYSIGVMGPDVEDTDQFNSNLENIASSSDHFEQLTDFNELEDVFSNIAESLTFANHFAMTTTGNDPGTVVRLTFDVTGQTSADAAASSKYIEGTLAYANGIWTFTDVVYTGDLESDIESGGSVNGTISGSNVNYFFRNIVGYDENNDIVQQWTKPSATSTSWQRNSEFDAAESRSMSTVVVQLVLDASTSLQDSQITQIRNAVNEFINTLYDRVYN